MVNFNRSGNSFHCYVNATISAAFVKCWRNNLKAKNLREEGFILCSVCCEESYLTRRFLLLSAQAGAVKCKQLWKNPSVSSLLSCCAPGPDLGCRKQMRHHQIGKFTKTPSSRQKDDVKKNPLQWLIRKRKMPEHEILSHRSAMFPNLANSKL